MAHLLYSPSKVHTDDDGQQGSCILNTTPSAVSLMPMTRPGFLIHPQHDTQPAASFKRLPVLNPIEIWGCTGVRGGRDA